MSVVSTSVYRPHTQVRKLSLPLFAGAALIAAMSTPVLAASLCVAPGGTGGCYATISAAVAAASPGSIIKVWPGTYKEDVVIGKSLSLLGAGSTNTIINAKGLNNAVYVDGLGNPGLSNVFVSGFTLENANFEGILITNASDVTVRGNYVTNNNNNLDVEMGTCPGIPDFETSEGEDCGEGIHLMGVSYSTIANNVSTGNSGGILNSDDTGVTHDNLITGNYVHDNGFACGITMASHGPYLKAPNAVHYGLLHNTIANNQSIHNGAGVPGAGAGVGIFSNGTGQGTVSGNTVIGNTLQNNGLPGVAFHSHVGPNFGLPADNLSNNQIIGNTISGNAADIEDTATPGTAGINVNSGAGGSPITGTVIFGNTIRNEEADVVTNTPAEVDVNFNNLLGGDTGIANIGPGTVNGIKNYWGCFAGPGAKGCSNVSGSGITYRPVLVVPFL